MNRERIKDVNQRRQDGFVSHSVILLISRLRGISSISCALMKPLSQRHLSNALSGFWIRAKILRLQHAITIKWGLRTKVIVFQYRLDRSLANQMFVRCSAWCVYDIYKGAREAFS